jgi:HlyD family secretion protein
MKAVRVRPEMWKLTAILAGAAVLIAVLYFSRKDESIQVLTAPATYQDVTLLVTTNGTVMPTNEFQARAFWPGIIQKVYVELGDKVKPGQMLVSMKDPFAISRVTAANAALAGARVGEENIEKGGSQEDLIGLQGDLAHARLSQTDAAKALASLQKLQQQGAASAAEVEAAQQKLQAANATLATLQAKSAGPYRPSDVHQARARVEDAQASLDAAKNQFNNANISSPMAGTVYSINVVAYDFVPVGADLIRVADLNNMQIRAYFDEPEIGKLAAGQPVKITWDGRPGRTWHGHIKQAPIAAMALGPRSVGECVIAVDDTKEDLLPNTNVIVTVTIQQHFHVLSIPRAALHTEGSANYVYGLTDGVLRRTSVDVGIVNLDRAEITRGLAENDVVAVNAVDGRDFRDGVPARNGPAPSGPGNSGSWQRRLFSVIPSSSNH